jgi:predicted HicB family RNase H-like nuclease
MNVTLSIDEQLVARARKKAEALGKSLNQLIRD